VSNDIFRLTIIKDATQISGPYFNSEWLLYEKGFHGHTLRTSQPTYTTRVSSAFVNPDYHKMIDY